jgi:hypothetical protein
MWRGRGYLRGYVRPLKQARPLSAIEEAERAGVDLSLIDDSLSRSYEERAIQHQKALNLMLEMERAGNKLRERYQSSASAPL